MTTRTKIGGMLLLGLLSIVAWLLATPSGRYTQFVAGGALVNLGYRLQDHHASYDFRHEQLTPDEVWHEILRQNSLAAAVRERFPRTTRRPLVALVVCMDARLDTSELTGDTRHFYFVIRTAGSVLSAREQEMLELAVEHGVKLIVLTTHSDCAAEKIAALPDGRQRFPALTQAVVERNERIHEFLARPMIAARVSEGSLAVKEVNIDTVTEHIVPLAGAP